MKLSIKSKLISGFVLIILSVLFLGFESLSSMNMLAGLTGKMYKHPLTVTKASLQANTAIVKIHRSMKDVALAHNSSEMQKAIADADLYNKEVLQQLEIVRQYILGREGEELIAETISSFTSWKPIRQEVIELMMAGDRVAAAAITKGKGAAHVKNLMEKMTALTEYASVKAKGFNTNAKVAYDDAVTMMVIVIVSLFITCVVIASVLIKHITQPLNDLQKTIDYIGKNSDLTNRVTIHREDEFGSIGNIFNTMIVSFKKAIGEVAGSSIEVSQAAEHTATINIATRDSIVSQHDQLHQLATSIEEMSVSIAEVAENTTLAAASAEDAGKETALGAELVLKTSQTVNNVSQEISGVRKSVKQLEVQGNNVTSVLDVIKSIAEQTNLLALNAAIEAARAGEQGRGFAVVADEVRTLAQRTQDSTSEIESMLSQFNTEIEHAVCATESGQTKVAECVEQAQKATNSLSNITSAVDTIKQMSEQIACAAEEQSKVTEEVSAYIASISEASSDTLNNVTESSCAITQQAKKAEELKQLAGQFIHC